MSRRGQIESKFAKAVKPRMRSDILRIASKTQYMDSRQGGSKVLAGLSKTYAMTGVEE